MRWSFRLGKIAGIPIQCHVTFLMMVAWIAVSRGLFTGQAGPALTAVALLLLVFLCVLLHELGHALTARRYGIETRDITLLPIGGVARLERMPEKPSQELLVALAGPAVNVVIAIVLAAVNRGLARPFLDMLTQGSLLESLLAVNVWIVLFNLIPAFPMDGGRVLRALLAMRLDYGRATTIASGVGQAVALVFGAFGVFSHNLILLLIALFVFLAAGEERSMVAARVSMRGIPVRDAMLTEFRWLDVADPLALAVRYLMAGSQTEFPVLEANRPIGMLGSAALIAALSRVGPDAPVGTIVGRDEDVCDVDDPLDAVLARVRQRGRRAIPVMSRGGLVGLLTLDNVGELLLVRNAIRRYQAHVQG